MSESKEGSSGSLGFKEGKNIQKSILNMLEMRGGHQRTVTGPSDTVNFPIGPGPMGQVDIGHVDIWQ